MQPDLYNMLTLMVCCPVVVREQQISGKLSGTGNGVPGEGHSCWLLDFACSEVRDAAGAGKSDSWMSRWRGSGVKE